jgi:hypothetical protein
MKWTFPDPAHSTAAEDYGRALAVWGQWLRQWRRTRDPRALRTALACKRIAVERLAVWQAELRLNRSVRSARTERAVREQLSVHRIMRQIRHDEKELRDALRTIETLRRAGNPSQPEQASTADPEREPSLT